jgi:GT2 family glycosyltransferase
LEESEVVIIDNGSPGQKVQKMAAKLPNARIVRNERNLGFAAAVNQGIRATATEWTALLNDDALPQPGWLEAMLTVGEGSPAIGAVASRMMFRDHSEVISSAGIRMDASAAPWDLWLGETEWPAQPVEVFGASGGACLLRREMLEDIGLFEESFFAYLEDADLAWRARLRGWKAVLAPDAVVHHALSATAGEGSRFKRYRLARNKWRMIVRNYPMPALAANLPVIVGYDMLSALNALRQGDTAPLHARLDAFQDMPALLAQRKAIQARRTAPWQDIEKALSPLESPLTLYRRSKLVQKLASRSEPAPA